MINDFSKNSLAINFAVTQDKKLVYLDAYETKLVAEDVDLIATSRNSTTIAYLSKGNIYLASYDDNELITILVKENAGNVKEIQMTESKTLAYLDDGKMYLASLRASVTDIITDIQADYKGINVIQEKKAPIFVEYGDSISDMVINDSHMIYVKNDNLYFKSYEEFLLKEGVKEIAPVIESPHAALIKDKENNIIVGDDFSTILPNYGDEPQYATVGQSSEPLVNSTFFQDGKLNVIFFYDLENPTDSSNVKFSKYELADDEYFYKAEMQNPADYPIALKYDGLDRLSILQYKNGNQIERIEFVSGEIRIRDKEGMFR